MPRKDLEQQSAPKAGRAPRRRAHKAPGPPVYVAGRSILTADGVKITGDVVDVSHWSSRSIAVSVSVGELLISGVAGARHVAVQRLRVADGWIEPGEQIPDDTWHSARGATCYLNLGQIRENPAAAPRL